MCYNETQMSLISIKTSLNVAIAHEHTRIFSVQQYNN